MKNHLVTKHTNSLNENYVLVYILNCIHISSAVWTPGIELSIWETYVCISLNRMCFKLALTTWFVYFDGYVSDMSILFQSNAIWLSVCSCFIHLSFSTKK